MGAIDLLQHPIPHQEYFRFKRTEQFEQPKVFQGGEMNAAAGIWNSGHSFPTTFNWKGKKKKNT